MTKTNIGSPWPLGSTITKRGVNFSVAAPFASQVQLLLFSTAFDNKPNKIITLSSSHRSGDYWHIEVEGIGAGCFYGYHINQSSNLNNSIDYSQKVLLDPCARAITGWEIYNRQLTISASANLENCLKGVVCERDSFDFTAHPRPRHVLSKSIIYELHVGGFTHRSSSEVNLKHRGTFLGLIEKIPYLKQLGITSVELLPVYAFDSSDSPRGKKNYWGYSPINWFTPHHEYIAGNDSLQARQQFRKMVSSFHDAGIEVILDVVYNHTTEGNNHGPVISWKGFAENLYYHINENGDYLDVSGCGNTIAANRPIVQQLIIESMRCWATELGIDGFRFDLGIALSRGEGLEPLDSPPLFKAIEADPTLSDLKLITEPWDCGGLYKIGDFPSQKMSTWNGYFRDDLRAFWKGDNNTVWKLKERLNGSPDLFNNDPNCISRSINFITSHDGFTLNDLVSFNHKHNLANGESNRDGENHNNSWNHGIEGPSTSISLNQLRARQKRNLLATLLLSPGVPMIAMGDEVSRSQGGNNNSWCQDSTLGWMIWNIEDCDSLLQEFVKRLIKIRKQLPAIFSPASSRTEKDSDLTLDEKRFSIRWHGIEIGKPDFSSWSHSLSFSIHLKNDEAAMWMGLNACPKNLNFQLPNPCTKWNLLVNTANQSPNDAPKEPPVWDKTNIDLENRSLVVAIDEGLSKSLRL